MENKPSHDEFETIAPAEVTLSRGDHTPTAGPVAHRPRLPAWALVAALFALSAGLIGWGLPEWLRPDTARIAAGPERPLPAQERVSAAMPGTGESEQDTASEASAEDDDVGTPVAPYRQSLFERERRAVQDLIAELMDLQDQLEQRAVERWGGDALAAAQTTADEGDTAFLEQDFETARTHYEAAREQLAALVERSFQVHAEALARGAEALRAGDAATATAAFELAVAIDGDSPAARTGIERAGRLDEVLAHVREAERLADAGELEAAHERLERALSLDAESVQANTALADVRELIRDRDYNAALSRGYAALADRELDRARTAFDRALSLQRGSPEAQEGLRMVERAATDRQIDALRREAQALERDEDWAQAAERYAQALELDDTLSFARQGHDRVTRHGDLQQRIEATLADPDKLVAEPELARARALLAQAREIDDPPTRLGASIDELDRLLSDAATPVPVTLRSDGATEVTILTVARLGAFEERTLELRPGVYTALGTRPGYRDVRERFRVEPSMANPVVVRCEERI